MVLSSAALPLCLVAGAPVHVALSLATTFALLFATATLAVRAIVLRVRAGGNAAAAAATSHAVLLLSGVSFIGLLLADAQDVLPRVTVIASSPALLTATLLALYPPSPAYLRAVGWALVLLSTITCGILVTI
jgi:hypothetical protein